MKLRRVMPTLKGVFVVTASLSNEYQHRTLTKAMTAFSFIIKYSVLAIMFLFNLTYSTHETASF
jgi:hypothetical protein